MSNKVGIEINGGGRNKISSSSILVEGNGKAIVLNDSVDNEILNVTILLKPHFEMLNQFQRMVNEIADNSINPTTDQEFKKDVLKSIPNIISATDKSGLVNSVVQSVGLLSSWITIKGELAVVLTPYIVELTKLITG